MSAAAGRTCRPGRPGVANVSGDATPSHHRLTGGTQ